MGGNNGGGTNKTAKEVLDEFGQKVYDQVKNGEAKNYISDLKGNLTSSTFFGGETAYSTNTCQLVDDYGIKTIGTGTSSDPCGNGKDVKNEERFSNTLGGQCTDSKMRNDGKGACAPYRRLSLCNKNLEYLNNYKSNTSKHYLLAKVCYAAKHEGESLKSYHAQHKQTNPDSQLCTALARSFADIGDIIRGKDLFRGNDEEKKQRKQLDNNLKTIFGNIYKELTTNGQKPAKDYYKDGEKDGNYYKLREDWWTANRDQVWEAITCKADVGNKYFHATCKSSGGGSSETREQARDKCRCPNSSNLGKKAGKASDDVNIVPTYFDYVPQYLRWFEEWAEDFCRLRKHKLRNAIKNCRGEENDKYCDINRHNCEQTIRGNYVFDEQEECHKCFLACSHFVKWIDNQKEEFLKQRNKYETEISNSGSGVASGGGARRKKRAATTSNYDGYEKKFHNEFKSTYSDVNVFLGLLNNETTCKENAEIEEGGKISFENVDRGVASGDKNGDIVGDSSNKTFYRTKYCEACPWCGAEKKGGKWRHKNDTDCGQGNDYRNYKNTDIPILTGDKTKSDMVQKYKRVCDANGGKGSGGTAVSGDNSDNATTSYCGGTNNNDKDPSLCEKWICYYKKNENDGGSGDINFCVLQDDKASTSKRTDKSYNAFFWDWVYHMLHDSVDWRKQLGSCINNNTNENTCKNPKKCNKECGCFEKWVKQKKTEWTKIKEHFEKQEDIKDKTQCNPFVTLEYLFMNDELLKSIKDTHADAKDDEIKNIEEMLNQAGVDGDGAFGALGGGDQCTEGANGKENTKIDEFLDKEEKEAKDCLQKQEECQRKKQQPKENPALRSLPPREPEEEEEEEEESESETEEDPQEESTKEVSPDEGSQPKETTTTDKSVDVCQIVGNALTGGDLNDACRQKYGKNAPSSWKCIPTEKPNVGTTSERGAGSSSKGETGERGRRVTREAVRIKTTVDSSSSSSGAICIPPRRRRLYVGKLTQWAEKQSQGEGSEPQVVSGEAAASQLNGQSTSAPQSPSNSRADGLLQAFVESAAVETFFLWDRYKKIKEKEKQEETEREKELVIGQTSEDPEQKKLQDEGEIPDEFLRQMFYTLGDYRDILFSGINDDSTKSSTYNDILRGDNEIREREKTIKEMLKKFFENGGNPPKKPGPPSTGSIPPSTTVKDPRETWWETNGPHIWKGMICSLTYKDSGSADKPPKHLDKVEKALFGNKTLTPGILTVPGGTLGIPGNKGAYETQYKYDEVTIGGITTEAIQTGESNRNAAQGTLLTDFIKRPFFFRWLEEWADEFCRKQKHKLYIIEKDCRGKDGISKICSGDGLDCNEEVPDKKDIFKYFDCSTCAKSCGFYRRWIERKKYEFDKQKERYVNESKDVDSNKDDNGFSTLLKQKYPEAKDFLNRLKNGPCKKDNGEDEIEFNEQSATFKHTKHCDPCSQFKVKCEKGSCRGSVRKEECKKKTITPGDIENSNVPHGNVVMLVSGKNTNGFPEELKSSCEHAGIFKGIRKDEWECRNVCGLDICTLEKNNRNAAAVHEHITVKEFLKRWLETFFEDYNKINKKLETCTKNEDGSPCIKGCVEKWVDMKREEWQNINEKYIQEYTKKNGDDGNTLTSFLDTFIPQTHVKKATGSCPTLEAFEKSSHCAIDASSEKNKEEKKKDVVECLLKKLEKKIEECQSKHSGKLENCGDNSTPVEDDDPFEEEDPDPDPENMRPNICPTQQEEVKEKDECKADVPQPDIKEEEEEKEEPATEDSGKEPTEEKPSASPSSPAEDSEKAKEKPDVQPSQPPVPAPQEPPPSAPVTPRPPPPEPQPPSKPVEENPFNHPYVIPALSSSTLMWSIGISFAALTYWLLKKKTKRPVDLFSVLEIPQNDYGIPTLKSKNRYIPYKSAQYRGKRYIYIEGDSGTDSGYTDHYSDITSSSESEYEEFDINDIYVPGSPKYKTLIEVVLEPSKRDTQSGDTIPNSGDTISNSGNTIPTSDIPSPITDEVWNTLKDEFISNMLQNEQPNDVPNDYTSGDIPTNTHPNTLYFDKPDEKPFIMSIHDRNLLSGEEYNYDMTTTNGQNDLYSGIDPKRGDNVSYSDKNGPYSDKNNSYSGTKDPYSGTKGPYSDKHYPYSGIDLINDTLNGDYDIYDEILKRKENELFGTNNVKHTSTHSVVLPTNSDPIHNQLDLFHKWLDRHRNMFEKLDNKVDILNQLKEEWDNDNNSGLTHTSSNIPSDENSIKNVLNTDVSIQIDMDTNQVDDIYLDTYPEKYTVDNINPNQTFPSNPNSVENNTYVNTPTNVQIEMNIVNNTKEIFEEEYPISDIWNI
ncbi:erythrocyte membrane protein 1, EMP1 [Plasmodium reichenowi]|uniref:Erythrocyte membrane protein 1, EMP1 n=1 Tax=Plasmodium reichenowi TaxID=5854 RepID=A0A060RQC7_PLARE|nr:erythrocyte membrane protein 1, EMP1 [Plasmodium reichenowi]